MLRPLIAGIQKRAELNQRRLPAGCFVRLVHDHRHMVLITAQMPAVTVGGMVKFSAFGRHLNSYGQEKPGAFLATPGPSLG